jgi:hypothetical protein
VDVAADDAPEQKTVRFLSKTVIACGDSTGHVRVFHIGDNNNATPQCVVRVSESPITDLSVAGTLCVVLLCSMYYVMTLVFASSRHC